MHSYFISHDESRIASGSSLSGPVRIFWVVTKRAKIQTEPLPELTVMWRER